MKTNVKIESEDAIKSLEAMVKRFSLKAQRAVKFKDTRSQNYNTNKVAGLKLKIKYLRDK